MLKETGNINKSLFTLGKVLLHTLPWGSIGHPRSNREEREASLHPLSWFQTDHAANGFIGRNIESTYDILHIPIDAIPRGDPQHNQLRNPNDEHS
jgi:hypothetical protein